MMGNGRAEFLNGSPPPLPPAVGSRAALSITLVDNAKFICLTRANIPSTPLPGPEDGNLPSSFFTE